MTTGEGGAIATNDDNLANKLRILRLHGISKDAWKRYSKEGSWYYEIEECGWKYNMTDINASIGIHQLRKLDEFIKIRQRYAKVYNQALGKIKELRVPIEKTDRNHIYHLYPLIVEGFDRNKFIEELTKRNIGTSVHFIPLHLHPFYRKKFGYKQGDFPVAERLYSKEVSLPLYPKMTQEDLDYVIESIKDILKKEDLILRPANDNDCKSIYEWRNNAFARSISRNKESIPFEEHENWFKNALKDNSKKIYVAENPETQVKVGQIRFDKKGNSSAEISITVDPSYQGKGYGSEILQQGIARYLKEEPKINLLLADIMPIHKISQRIFEKARFKKIGEKDGWLSFSLTRETFK